MVSFLVREFFDCALSLPNRGHLRLSSVDQFQAQYRFDLELESLFFRFNYVRYLEVATFVSAVLNQRRSI